MSYLPGTTNPAWLEEMTRLPDPYEQPEWAASLSADRRPTPSWRDAWVVVGTVTAAASLLWSGVRRKIHHGPT